MLLLSNKILVIKFVRVIFELMKRVLVSKDLIPFWLSDLRKVRICTRLSCICIHGPGLWSFCLPSQQIIHYSSWGGSSPTRKPNQNQITDQNGEPKKPASVCHWVQWNEKRALESHWSNDHDEPTWELKPSTNCTRFKVSLRCFVNRSPKHSDPEHAYPIHPDQHPVTSTSSIL